MGIIVNKEARKSWLLLKYPNNNTSGVGATFNLIFTRSKLKEYGYCKVFTPKEKSLKGRIFYIAIEGDEYHDLIKKHFGYLESTLPPPREELARVCGATIEHDWMFQQKD